MTTPSLTLFFVVEPPDYLYMACHLAASIRAHMPPEVVLIGYCPAHRWADMHPAAVEVLRRLRCEIRPIETAGRFDPPYPHGNKILAALAPKQTDFAAFLDSDMLMVHPCTVGELVRPNAVGVVPTVQGPDPSVWLMLHGIFGMQMPSAGDAITSDDHDQPGFDTGLIVIDEAHRSADGRRFAELWMDTAQAIDAAPGIDNRRLYLDQMSLPIAIRRAGMDRATLDERYNYSIGGILRGKPMPQNTPTIVHYRKREILREAGLDTLADQLLAGQVGTRRVRWIFQAPLPPGIAPAPAPAPVAPATGIQTPPAAAGQAEALARRRVQRPDPSKATLAAVTMVRGDHEFLQRWVDHHAATIGRRNLYVLRHGPDAQIDRIAAGANIVNVPLCADVSGFDRRRWGMLSNFASGLTLYYNWVLVNDVDELVMPDPSTGLNLPDYLTSLFDQGLAAPVLSPFAVELVHTPASEPDPIRPDQPILSVRRNFRINSNYAKPCLIRQRVRFSVGGHGSNVEAARLDPRLWLFHLRYADDAISTERLRLRQAFIAEKAGGGDTPPPSGSTWARGTSELENLRVLSPVAERSAFPDEIERMTQGRQQASGTGNWFWGRVRSRELYRLPPSFGTPF